MKDWNEVLTLIMSAIAIILSTSFSLISILGNRPSLKVKVKGNKLQISTKVNGVFGSITDQDKINDILNSTVEALLTEIKVSILFSNKGNKKTTVNEMYYLNSKHKKEIKMDHSLIPLDVGESVIKEFKITLHSAEEINSFYDNTIDKPKLIVIDNRGKKIKIKLDNPTL